MRDIYEFLGAYLPPLIDPVVVEAGCAQAEDTPRIINLLRGDHWKYYAFEPDPRSAEVFISKITDPRVIFKEAAVGEKEGLADFHLSGPKHVWSSSLRKPKTHLQVSPRISFLTMSNIQVTTLDIELASEKKIDFLWADIQGCELDMLKGATQILPKISYLYLEYSDEELYEGQALYNELVGFLHDFEAVHKFDGEVAVKHAGDVLLRNRRNL